MKHNGKQNSMEGRIEELKEVKFINECSIINRTLPIPTNNLKIALSCTK